MISSQEVLQKYLDFFKERGHVLIPNMSLVPENDPTILFVNSGMFPLVPYLSGEKHPLGTRLMNVQRSLRFNDDLDEIGNTIRHTLAFHMIGNWSLGDYFKKDQLNWLYEFLIEHLKLDPSRIYATVFEGDKDAPFDEEAVDILKDIFKKYGITAELNDRIFPYGKKENWWQRGEAIGELGGPDSEIFYFIGEDPVGKSPANNDDEFIEFGNSVFMQYKRSEKGWEELPKKNVDFGGGLERIVMIAQDKKDIYETDMYWPVIEKIQTLSKKSYYNDGFQVKKNMRILADHMRACVLLGMDGVIPSNKDQGYIYRQLIRRLVRTALKFGIEDTFISELTAEVVKTISWLYPELPAKRINITCLIDEEATKFKKLLVRVAPKVIQEISKNKNNTIENYVDMAFDFFQSQGYPKEIFLQDLAEADIKVNEKEFDVLYKEKFTSHKDQSREGAEQKFKGGLADHNEQTIRYHTTTHLLHWALRKVLGDQVIQQGSNITGERLRFDFNHSQKLTDAQIKEVEELVNNEIKKALPVNYVMLPKDQAEKTGAIHAFGEKYGDSVKVYFIGDSLENAVSKEFCGGPHVTNTKDLLPIEIFKQSKIGEAVLRVYIRFIPVV